MKKILLSAIALGAIATVAVPAQARDGCGRGDHRGPYGHCRPNGWRGGPPPGAWVEGRYYEGRGYWHGGRWWRHRDEWRRGRDWHR